jgi:hypothetical protein
MVFTFPSCDIILTSERENMKRLNKSDHIALIITVVLGLWVAPALVGGAFLKIDQGDMMKDDKSDIMEDGQGNMMKFAPSVNAPSSAETGEGGNAAARPPPPPSDTNRLNDLRDRLIPETGTRSGYQ